MKLYNCVCNVIYTHKRYCNVYVRGLVCRANSTFLMGMRQVVSNILGLYWSKKSECALTQWVLLILISHIIHPFGREYLRLLINVLSIIRHYSQRNPSEFENLRHHGRLNVNISIYFSLTHGPFGIKHCVSVTCVVLNAIFLTFWTLKQKRRYQI